MPFHLELPEALRLQGWKVKIRDRERLEQPHATVLHGCRAWRFGLRDRRFLDDSPHPREVPEEIHRILRSRRGALQEAWDRMYPENPVGGRDEN